MIDKDQMEMLHLWGGRGASHPSVECRPPPAILVLHTGSLTEQGVHTLGVSIQHRQHQRSPWKDIKPRSLIKANVLRKDLIQNQRSIMI